MTDILTHVAPRAFPIFVSQIVLLAVLQAPLIPNAGASERASLAEVPEVRFPLYPVRVYPTTKSLPPDWSQLSELKPFSAPFVLQWRVDPPSNVHKFEVRLAGPGSQHPVVLASSGLDVNLASVWDQLPTGINRYEIVAYDAGGKKLGFSLLHHFVKDAHPVKRLRLPERKLPDGAQEVNVDWIGVESALLRHIRPFDVTPQVKDEALRQKTEGWQIDIAHLGGCESWEGTGRVLNTASVWDSVVIGPCSLRIAAVGAEGSVIALSREYLFKKGADFQPAGRDAVEPRNRGKVIRRIARYLIAARTPNAYQPDKPIYFWHSGVDEWGNVPKSSYSSQFEVGVEAWLLFRTWAQRQGWAGEADIALAQARRMVDFLLEHRTPTDWVLGGVTATTLTRGELGGGAEGDSISLPGIATIARTFVWMHEQTDETKYLEAARHVADLLVQRQKPDGSWPWRVNAETGARDRGADYTSQVIEIVRLFRLLDASRPQPELREGARRGLQWILKNPVKTHRWEGYYIDDPGGMALYSGVSQLDAVWTARFLVDRRDENEGYLGIAAGIEQWVEDHFVIYGRETHYGNSSIVSTEPITPAVIEKPFYQRTVTGETANWLGLLLDLYRVTGDERYWRKAEAADAAIIKAVLPAGAVSPESPDLVLGSRPVGETLWFWNAWAVLKGLLEMELFER